MPWPYKLVEAACLSLIVITLYYAIINAFEFGYTKALYDLDIDGIQSKTKTAPKTQREGNLLKYPFRASEKQTDNDQGPEAS